MLFKRIIVVLMIFITSIIYAQVVDGSQFPRGASFETDPLANYWQKRTPMMDKLFRDHLKDDDGYEKHYVGAEIGSAYEDDQFKPGKVFYKEEYLGDFYYRHNAYNSEIELRRTTEKEEKQKALIKNEEVSLLDSKGREMRFLTFTTKKGKPKEGYLTLLVDGEKYKLYHRLAVKFTEAKAAANSMVNPIPSKFTHFTEYYIKEKNADRITEIPLKTGKFLKVIGAQNKDLADHIKKQDLDLAIEPDLINVFEFLNN